MISFPARCEGPWLLLVGSDDFLKRLWCCQTWQQVLVNLWLIWLHDLRVWTHKQGNSVLVEALLKQIQKICIAHLNTLLNYAQHRHCCKAARQYTLTLKKTTEPWVEIGDGIATTIHINCCHWASHLSCVYVRVLQRGRCRSILLPLLRKPISCTTEEESPKSSQHSICEINAVALLQKGTMQSA